MRPREGQNIFQSHTARTQRPLGSCSCLEAVLRGSPELQKNSYEIQFSTGCPGSSSVCPPSSSQRASFPSGLPKSVFSSGLQWPPWTSQAFSWALPVPTSAWLPHTLSGRHSQGPCPWTTSPGLWRPHSETTCSPEQEVKRGRGRTSSHRVRVSSVSLSTLFILTSRVPDLCGH